MKTFFTESELEDLTLATLEQLGFMLLHGPAISEEGKWQERTHHDVLLLGRLRAAVHKLNPGVDDEALEEAVRQVQRVSASSLLAANQQAHTLLTEGVFVKVAAKEGQSGTVNVRLVNWEGPYANDLVAVNQLTVREGQHHRRPDIVLFVNGIPLVVIELKNPANPEADTRSAFQQLQTYLAEIPSLFVHNAFLVVSDGVHAQAGTLTADFGRFMQWKTVDGEVVMEPEYHPQLDTLVRGLLDPPRLLDMVGHFLLFQPTLDPPRKVMAAYHQYHAVNKALESTLRATSTHLEVGEDPELWGRPSVKQQPPGDRKAGVVWHTQGSGKSLSMVFYAHKLVLAEDLENPTLVVLTDRNDLDQQLFDTFAASTQLLRQTPVQATDRQHLRSLLQVASGGIVFTTVQKFLPEAKGDIHPLLSGRSNLIVIADEAHRSQYDFIDGFARHLRNALPYATFIGFTGTPIELDGKDTQAVFGNYVDVYDLEQAVRDQATVRIFYESRLARVRLSAEAQRILDEKVEEVTEEDEMSEREQRLARWAGKEAVVGSADRIRQVAADMVAHLEQRQKTASGKAMAVTMSRRICVELYNALVALRPDWHSNLDSEGAVKVIMTGSASDPAEWQQHIRNKPRRKMLTQRLKDPHDPLQLVIVRDMLLTGFDAPCLHTLYIDKPMGGHNLMQAIARVNRVFPEKEGGLIVDYVGIAQDLREAMKVYARAKGRGQLTLDKDVAIAKMQELHEQVCDLLFGFDWRRYHDLESEGRMALMVAATNHISGLEEQTADGVRRNGRQRFRELVLRLSRAFALVAPDAAADAIVRDVALFQALNARLTKLREGQRTRGHHEVETAIRQLVNDAIITHDVVDVFEAAGMAKPTVSILSEEFLNKLRNLPHRNLAIELLRRLLNDEITSPERRNLVRSRKFSELLADAVRRYQNGLLDSAQILEELLGIGRDLRAADARGEALNMRDDEIAFYDALLANANARKVMEDQTLRTIVEELIRTVRQNATLDWQIKEGVRAKLRVMVKRILRKYKYPPDDPATGEYTTSVQRVLEQAELFADVWGE